MNSTERAGKDTVRIVELLNGEVEYTPELVDFLVEVFQDVRRAYDLITFMALGLEKFVFMGKAERMMEFLDVINEWAGEHKND